jgi:hypothetical protein
MSYTKHLPTITTSSFIAELSVYTKSKAKDKTKIVEKICDYLNNIETIYHSHNLKQKTMFNEFLKRRICIYSCDLILLLLENNDWKGLERMLEKGCCQVDEIVIITSVFDANKLNACIENLSVCNNEILRDLSFWKHQAVINECNELEEYVDKMQEEIEQKENGIKKDLTALCDKMKLLGLSKEELLKMLNE